MQLITKKKLIKDMRALHSLDAHKLNTDQKDTLRAALADENLGLDINMTSQAPDDELNAATSEDYINVLNKYPSIISVSSAA